jgi:hypothetical protein
MVVNPLLRGLLGLDVEAALQHVDFAPHVPAGWNSFSISNLRVGQAELSLKYTRTADAITLESERTGAGDCTVDFAPALSLRAKVLGAELNGKATQFHAQTNSIDQHVAVSFAACAGSNKLVLHLHNDFGLSFDSRLPALGAVREGLRVVSELWSAARETLTLDVSGAAAQQYELAVLNPGQIRAVEGAELVNGKLRIGFPAGAPGVYSRRSITLHFQVVKPGR